MGTIIKGVLPHADLARAIRPTTLIRSPRLSSLLGADVLLASDAHTTDDSDTLPAEKIIAFYNETLNGFWAGEREVRVQPASEIHFAEQ